jgi:hypothetical protein
MLSTWPGLINMAIDAAANGAIYAAGVGVLGILLAMPRRR